MPTQCAAHHACHDGRCHGRGKGGWWIIAGAAAALHGAGEEPTAGVDLLLDIDGAVALFARIGIAGVTNGGSALFRSAVFGRWTVPPLPVEVMAGFEYRGARGWQRVCLTTRQAVTVDGRALFVPEAAELAALLRGFGREKDLRRAAMLDRISAVPASATERSR